MKVRVKEIMTRECKACDPSDSLAAAAIRMWDADCGVLPVVESGHVVGVITDRDICMALALKGCRPGESSVFEAMSGEVWSCAPETDVAAALALMAKHRVRRLPVLEDARLAGMLSINDVVNCAGENEALRQPILATFESLCAHRTLPAVPAVA